MVVGRVLNKNGDQVCSRVRYADNFLLRFRGLLDANTLGPGEGLWLSECSSVHMFGMKINLDLVFLDRSGKVVKILRNVKKNRPYYGALGATSVIELGVGSLTFIKVGDVLKFEPADVHSTS